MSAEAYQHSSVILRKCKGVNELLICTLMVCALLLVCGGCEKDSETKGKDKDFEIDKPYERGPLSVHIRLQKSEITIAQTVTLELEATISPEYELVMPEVGKSIVNFGIVDWDSPGDKLDADNNIVKVYQYRLEPFLSGSYQIPAFAFEFSDANDADGKKYELTTEPIDIEVTSLLGEDRSKLQIADIEDVVEMPEEPGYLWVWVVTGIGVTAIFVVWFILRQKRIVELVHIFKPAHEIAYERLRVLVRDDLIKAGRIREFYQRISDILRHYIEHRFELKAPERTTEEFLFELRDADVLCQSDKDSLAEFLRHCDLVKFAKHNPTAEQIQRTFDLVKEFIEKTKSDERKIDVTDSVESNEIVEAHSL